MINKQSVLAEPIQQAKPLTKGLVLLMAVSCGMSVANLYYSQPLLVDIGVTFDASAGKLGILSMLTQIGYALGLFLFIPLGDIKERRSLIAILLVAVGISLIGVATAQNLGWMYLASLAVGVTTVAPQMIVPLAAALARPEERGKVIGNVMSGLLIGILLARTIAGFIGGLFGWRLMYALAAIMMFVLAYALWRKLPKSYPEMDLSYGKLIKSLGTLVVEQRTLRETALIGALILGTFSVFWTTLTFFLEGPHYRYGSEVAGLFGLIGVVGAAAASLVGRLTDKLSAKRVVGFSIIMTFISYLSFWLFGTMLWGLIVGVILLDLGVQATHISNQSRVYRMMPEARSRLNTVYMVGCFIGAALGSSLGSFAWSLWEWTGVCLVGGGMALLALLVWLFHRAGKK